MSLFSARSADFRLVVWDVATCVGVVSEGWIVGAWLGLTVVHTDVGELVLTTAEIERRKALVPKIEGWEQQIKGRAAARKARGEA